MKPDKAIPWWNTLPEDFHRTPFQPAMRPTHAWKVTSSAAVDIALRTAAASLVGAAMAPRMLGGGLARELESLDFHRQCADHWLRDTVFQMPPDIRIEEREAPLLAYHPDGIPHCVLRFSSPYVAIDPALRETYTRHERSHRSVAQYWYHPNKKPRKTLIFLHGFLADAYWFNSAMFSLQWFWKKGYDIVLMTLPFHGVRARQFDPFSGFGLFAHGLGHFNEAMLQAVCDVRVLVSWLQARGAPSVGISGLSLGGYLSALTASVDDRLAFCIPNSCVVSPVDMMMEWAPVSWAGSALLKHNGISIRDLRHGMALHCPLSWTPRLPPERLMIIGGAGDRLVAPRYIDLLHRHWAGSTQQWFPGNHIVHLHQGSYLRRMRKFMDAAADAAR